MRRILILAGFLGFLPIICFAQYDSVVNANRREFDLFKRANQDKQTHFIQYKDSVFISFLKEAWNSVNVLKGNEPEAIPKPVVQPVMQTGGMSREIKSVKPEESFFRQDDWTDGNIGELSPEITNAGFVINSFEFFGAKEKVYSPQHKPSIDKIGQKEIVSFFSELAKSTQVWEYDLNILKNVKHKYSLNDWGYYLLLKSASEKIFDNVNEQRLFTWFMLLKSGYRTKIGYDETQVYVMLSSKHKLFYTLYLNSSKDTYYFVDRPGNELQSVKTYKADYPGNNKLFSFILRKMPEFNDVPVYRTIKYQNTELSLRFNKHLIDFLYEYPHCELATYFSSAVNESIFKELDSVLLALLENKSLAMRVDELLAFTQKAFDYKTDYEQFGKERYFFAEECLFYPYSDCEDRSVLFAKLIKRYLDMPSIGLIFPGHVALAVHFPYNNEGSFIMYKGQRYLVCDPTFVNAKSGILAPGYEYDKAEIVVY